MGTPTPVPDLTTEQIVDLTQNITRIVDDGIRGEMPEWLADDINHIIVCCINAINRALSIWDYSN